MTDCICSGCRTKYVRKLKNPKYTPQKTRKKERSICFLFHYDRCVDKSLRDCECELE